MSRSGALYLSAGGVLQSLRAAPGSYETPGYFTAYGSVANPTDAQCRFAAFFVSGPGSRVYDRISMGTVTTPGAAGALTRLGIYRDAGTARPGALVLDAGTVDTSQPVGAFEVTINQTLAPGAYWLACAPQGAPATHATTRSFTPGLTLPITNSPLATIELGWTGTAVYAGALPDPASNLVVGTQPFMVWLRAA